MKHRLLYQNAEGVLKIIVPDAAFQQPKEDDSSAISRIYALSLPGVTEFIVCGCEDIPKDKTFREAWKKGDKSEPVKIDLDKAILIHRDRLQQACKIKISLLDKDLESAKKRSNLPEQVAITKTQEILATMHMANLTHCKTVDELKYSIPKEIHDVWNFYPVS